MTKSLQDISVPGTTKGRLDVKVVGEFSGDVCSRELPLSGAGTEIPMGERRIEPGALTREMAAFFPKV